MEHGDDLAEGALELLQQVGDHDGDTPADAGHAVNQHVGVPPSLLNEIEGLIEKFIDLVLLVILCGEIEVVGYVVFVVPEQPAPRH